MTVFKLCDSNGYVSEIIIIDLNKNKISYDNFKYELECCIEDFINGKEENEEDWYKYELLDKIDELPYEFEIIDIESSQAIICE